MVNGSSCPASSTLKLDINIIDQKIEITLENINQYRGRTTQAVAAKELGVGVSTLKRRCRDLGVKCWHERDDSSKIHKKTKSVEIRDRVIQVSEIGQCSKADATENEPAAAEYNEDDTTSLMLWQLTRMILYGSLCAVTQGLKN